MRSFGKFTALAVLSSLNLAAASPCNPYGSSTLTTATNPHSSSFSSDFSSDVPSTTVTQSYTATSSTSSASATVTNDIKNGGFTDVGDGTNVPGYTGSSLTIDTTNGYRGGGSKDTNCAKISTSAKSVVFKRQEEASAYLSQEVASLETDSTYTVRFSLALVSSSGVSCTLQASLESQFYEQTIVSSASINWETYTQEAAVTTSTSGTLTFSFTCASSDTVTIYIDSIFMSNKVTPANIDDATLDWGDEVNSGVISTTVGGETITSTTASPTTVSPTTTTFSRPVTRTRVEGTMIPSATCPGAVTPTPLATCVSRTPAPSSLTCGVLGVKGWDWWAYAPFVTKSQTSVADCALLCYQDALNCNAFAYIADYGGRSICAFGYYSLAEDGLTPGEAATAYTWYDRDCYQCEDCAS